MDKTLIREEYRRRDVKNTNHVNLVVRGFNFRVVCLIDRDYEIQVIDAVHLVLNGEGLFEKERYNLLPKRRWNIKDILKRENNCNAIEETVVIDEGRLEERLKRR